MVRATILDAAMAVDLSGHGLLQHKAARKGINMNSASDAHLLHVVESYGIDGKPSAPGRMRQIDVAYKNGGKEFMMSPFAKQMLARCGAYSMSTALAKIADFVACPRRDSDWLERAKDYAALLEVLMQETTPRSVQWEKAQRLQRHIHACIEEPSSGAILPSACANGLLECSTRGLGRQRSKSAPRTRPTIKRSDASVSPRAVPSARARRHTCNAADSFGHRSSDAAGSLGRRSLDAAGGPSGDWYRSAGGHASSAYDRLSRSARGTPLSRARASGRGAPSCGDPGMAWIVESAPSVLLGSARGRGEDGAREERARREHKHAHVRIDPGMAAYAALQQGATAPRNGLRASVGAGPEAHAKRDATANKRALVGVGGGAAPPSTPRFGAFNPGPFGGMPFGLDPNDNAFGVASTPAPPGPRSPRTSGTPSSRAHERIDMRLHGHAIPDARSPRTSGTPSAQAHERMDVRLHGHATPDARSHRTSGTASSWAHEQSDMRRHGHAIPDVAAHRALAGVSTGPRPSAPHRQPPGAEPPTPAPRGALPLACEREDVRPCPRTSVPMHSSSVWPTHAPSGEHLMGDLVNSAQDHTAYDDVYEVAPDRLLSNLSCESSGSDHTHVDMHCEEDVHRFRNLFQNEPAKHEGDQHPLRRGLAGSCELESSAHGSSQRSMDTSTTHGSPRSPAGGRAPSSLDGSTRGHKLLLHSTDMNLIADEAVHGNDAVHT